MKINQPNLSFRPLTYGNNPSLIVLHHAEASTCSVYDVHSWHKDGNGWAGIGYHYFVRKDGSIWKGRPDNAQGAHCPGKNATSIGVCAEGAYNKETMPTAQKNAIKELCSYLKSKYGITQIGGHREYYSTDCPGSNFPLNEFKGTSGSSNGSASTGGSGSSSSSSNGAGGSYYNVKEVQNMLITIGYPCGSYGADGTWGTGTYTAVTSFQRDCNLTVDGWVGEKTYARLVAEYKKKIGSGSSPSNNNSTDNSSKWVNLDGKKGYVNTPSGVNIRAGKSTSAAKLGTIANGTQVSLFRLEGDWMHIYYPPHGGYVAAKYIKY